MILYEVEGDDLLWSAQRHTRVNLSDAWAAVVWFVVLFVRMGLCFFLGGWINFQYKMLTAEDTQLFQVIYVMILTNEVKTTTDEELKKEVNIPLRMWSLFTPLLLIILLHLNDLYVMIQYWIKSGKFVFKYDYMVFQELKMEVRTQSDKRHRSILK